MGSRDSLGLKPSSVFCLLLSEFLQKEISPFSQALQPFGSSELEEVELDRTVSLFPIFYMVPSQPHWKRPSGTNRGPGSTAGECQYSHRRCTICSLLSVGPEKGGYSDIYTENFRRHLHGRDLWSQIGPVPTDVPASPWNLVRMQVLRLTHPDWMKMQGW